MTDEFVGNEFQQPGGWLIEEEDWAYLDSRDDESQVVSWCGNYEEIPFDPRSIMKVENQRNQGACQGHAVSTCQEFCYYLATNDFETQFSRAMGYYESQRRDGISGDRGSTISGGCNLVTEVGICEEALWPYPSSYNPKRPRDWQKVLDNAQKFRIKRQNRLTTYQGVRTFLGSGQGAINIGIGWSGSMSRAVIESYRPGGGGHAIALICLSERKDSQGRPYVWMLNSWGTSFGNQGWSEWSPRAVEQMLNSRSTVAIGLSDMLNVEPRKIHSREGWMNYLEV